jgi:hypothetical protein
MISRSLTLMGIAALIVLSIPVPVRPARLSEESVAGWDEYVQRVCVRSEMRVKHSPFLWISELPLHEAEVHSGEILVWSAGEDRSSNVTHAQIHDWMGAVFIPQARISDVLSVIRDYDHYAEIYAPSVVEAKRIVSTASEDKFSMILKHKELFITAAVQGEYAAQYIQVDETHWYAISRSTRLQAIEHFSQPNMRVLSPDEGPGYIWRLYSFAKFEQKNDGVYIELEALGLSRDVPLMWRWLVDPIVSQLARASVHTTLEQTRDAVLFKITSALVDP